LIKKYLPYIILIVIFTIPHLVNCEYDKEFKYHVQVIQENSNRLVNSNIFFYDFGSKSRIAGLAFPFFNVILIDENYWKRLGVHQQTLLLYHEVTHTRFYFFHDEELLPDHCPKSAMHPKTIPYYCSIEHYKHYLSELKNEYP
jgi:hypothetical protein